MSEIAEIMDDMADIADEIAGDSVVYTPLRGAPFRVPAVPGPTTRIVATGEEIALSREERIFGIRASLLAIGGVPYEPRIGDMIAETVNGVTYTYAAMVLDGNKDCWAWADRYRTRRHIHTKLTLPAEAA